MSDTPLALARGMTVRETARYLRIGPDRVRSLIRSGELNHDQDETRSFRCRA